VVVLNRISPAPTSKIAAFTWSETPRLSHIL
jgi:hypothetical protein